jgi:hypothetical protein
LIKPRIKFLISVSTSNKNVFPYIFLVGDYKTKFVLSQPTKTDCTVAPCSFVTLQHAVGNLFVQSYPPEPFDNVTITGTFAQQLL